jgi:uncharacterized protein YbcV (DUF1398 family)
LYHCYEHFGRKRFQTALGKAPKRYNQFLENQKTRQKHLLKDKYMFTIDQIHDAFKKVKSGADFPKFVQDLKAIGVTHYDNYVADGRTKYFGTNNLVIDGEMKYPSMPISDKSSAEKLKHSISIHQQGKTDYMTFCKQAADAGVEKWTTHMIEMTVTYLDKGKNKLAVEPIPKA